MRTRDLIQGQALFEMANLRPDRTGLPFVVFISQKGGARQDVRVKIARRAKVRVSDMISVTVRPTVRAIGVELPTDEMEALTRWIDLNRDVLVKYWTGEIEYTEDAIAALQKI